jgi:hypothetical protein
MRRTVRCIVVFKFFSSAGSMQDLGTVCRPNINSRKRKCKPGFPEFPVLRNFALSLINFVTAADGLQVTVPAQAPARVSLNT